MGRVTTKGFMDKTGSGGGKFSKWKQEGSSIGYIHPDIGFWERDVHGSLPIESTKEDGSVEVRNRRFNCCKTRKNKRCPNCDLVAFAKQAVDDGADPDELIISLGSDAQRYTLKDLTGKGHWKNRLAAKGEFLFAWVRAKNRNDEFPAEIVIAGEGLSRAVKRSIKSAQNDYGEKEGDPLRTPYPMKLIYNKDEDPQYMYDCERADKDLAPMDKEIEEIFSGTDEDLNLGFDKLCEPGDFADVLEAVEAAWASRRITFEEFCEWAGYEADKGGDRGGDGSEKKKEAGGRSKEAPKEAPAGGKVCPECGIPVTKKFCPECGAKAVEGQAKAAGKGKPKGGAATKGKGGKAEVVCPDCKSTVRPNRFGKCPECKAPLDVPF